MRKTDAGSILTAGRGNQVTQAGQRMRDGERNDSVYGSVTGPV